MTSMTAREKAKRRVRESLARQHVLTSVGNIIQCWGAGVLWSHEAEPLYVDFKRALAAYRRAVRAAK